MTIPKTLVLNKDYQPFNLFPLQTIDAGEAVKRVMNGTCSVVTEYKRQIKTPNHVMYWPSIIVKTDKYVQLERIAILRKEALYYRDGKKCAYCLKPLRLKGTHSTMDHVIPRGRGGKHVWENVVLSCEDCNHTKAMSLPNDIWKPKIKPYRPTYGQLIKIRRNYPITVYHESWIDFIGPWNAEIIIEK